MKDYIKITLYKYGGVIMSEKVLIVEDEVKKSEIEFTLQFAKRYQDLALRIGLMENTFGVGADYFFDRDRGRVKFYVWDFGADEANADDAHARVGIDYNVFKYIFVNITNKSIMKQVEAIIRKSKFDDVKNALHQIEVNFFSYWDVTGVGNEKQGHVYRGISYSTSDIQRRYLSIVISDEFLERTVEAILESAYTGNVGDGKIFVSEIVEAYRIRTKENGHSGIN